MRSRILAAVTAILAVAGVAVAVYAFRGVHGGSASSGRCPGRAGLGQVAYVRGGDLHVVDLGTCTDRVVASGAAPPVRWSPDARWIAFGEARVVSARGGRVRTPLGDELSSWTWSPAHDVLAGVTAHGGVMTGGPGADSERARPDGWGATSVAFSPDGTLLAVGNAHSEQGIVVEDLRTGAWRSVYRVRPGRVAPPRVAGWAPDGGWILFWPYFQGSASLAADGLPLEAVRSSGGSPVPIAPTLPYPDFLSWCGRRLAVGVGGDRYVTHGKRVAVTSAPRWSRVNVSREPARSWFWPSCSPDGTRIAVTSTRNVREGRFDTTDRTLWLLGPSGETRKRLVGRDGDAVSDETPRWSADGRWVLFVRRARHPGSPGDLHLVEVGSRHVYGPIATLPGGVDFYGHSRWDELSDWYRPG